PPRAPALRQRLAQGWEPDQGAIDVIKTPDGLVSLDNTRVAVAQELGLPAITARVRGWNEPLPTDFPEGRLASFARKAEKLGLPMPTNLTWGDLFTVRTMDNKLPPSGTATRPRMP